MLLSTWCPFVVTMVLLNCLLQEKVAAFFISLMTVDLWSRHWKSPSWRFEEQSLFINSSLYHQFVIWPLTHGIYLRIKCAAAMVYFVQSTASSGKHYNHTLITNIMLWIRTYFHMIVRFMSLINEFALPHQ